MCLVVVSFKQHAEFPLLIAANRDEFYKRPAAPLDWWSDAPHVLAGRDTSAPDGGTWLGVNRTGRFAVVTNFRDPGKESKTAKSRGLLIKRFLSDAMPTVDFTAELHATRAEYNGFNLLFGSSDELVYFSNRREQNATLLEPGLHVLSNAYLDTPWPKTERARSAFAALPAAPAADAVLSLLADNTRASAETVQQTGLPLDIELALSPIFVAVKGPALSASAGLGINSVEGYGTRVSSYVTFGKSGAVSFLERTYLEGKMQFDRAFSFD